MYKISTSPSVHSLYFYYDHALYFKISVCVDNAEIRVLLLSAAVIVCPRPCSIFDALMASNIQLMLF